MYLSLEFRRNTIEKATNCSKYDFLTVRNKELKVYNFIMEMLVVCRLLKGVFS